MPKQTYYVDFSWFLQFVCARHTNKLQSANIFLTNNQVLRHARFEVEAVVASAFQQLHSTVFALNCRRSGLHIIGL